MSSITFKQVGQVALTLGVSFCANKLIESGFQAWNSKNTITREHGDQVVPRIAPLGALQETAKLVLTIGVAVLAANYSGLISLSNLASRITNETPEVVVPATGIVAKTPNLQAVETPRKLLLDMLQSELTSFEREEKRCSQGLTMVELAINRCHQLLPYVIETFPGKQQLLDIVQSKLGSIEAGKQIILEKLANLKPRISEYQELIKIVAG